jgi:hypothetical protein
VPIALELGRSPRAREMRALRSWMLEIESLRLASEVNP